MLRIHCIGSILFVIALASGCDNPVHKMNNKGEFDLHQLEGRWEYLDARTNQIEEWTLEGDKELKGRGFVLEEGDTTFIEFLNIRNVNGKLTYFAQVSDIPSAEMVPFTVVKQNQNTIEFMNTAQDFPKIIGYEITSENTMQSYIEGPRDGQNIRIMFNFEKK